LFLLIGAFLTACGVSIHHYFQVSPFILDLVIPPTLAIYLLVNLAYIAKYPNKISVVIQALIFVAIIALCVPAWYYPLLAFRSDQHTLLEILPPITPIIFPLALGIVAFLNPRHAPPVFLLTWLVFSAPILTYLITHSSELSSPRGIEIAVTLGPIMLSVITLLLASQGLKQEVLQLYAQKSDLKTIAEQDVLTGLLNRRAGQELLKKALQQTDSNFGLILFDVDRFKRVNDEHGHDVGDKALQNIVQRCKSRVRLHDFFIRWGGEEFMLILPDANLDETFALAEELRVLIAAKPLSNGLVSAASFGGTIRQSFDDTASLFKRVDEALYEAKNSGRNKVVSKI
jgi:diguanylate cyclase (GGDEF)-like protein